MWKSFRRYQTYLQLPLIGFGREWPTTYWNVDLPAAQELHPTCSRALTALTNPLPGVGSHHARLYWRPAFIKGYDTILGVFDKLTKHHYFILLKHPISAYTVAADYVKEILRLHGFPVSIVSDPDRIFMSLFWRELFGCKARPFKEVQLTTQKRMACPKW